MSRRVVLRRILGWLCLFFGMYFFYRFWFVGHNSLVTLEFTYKGLLELICNGAAWFLFAVVGGIFAFSESKL